MSVGSWVLVYLALTVLVGVMTSRLVRNASDFMNASRRMPFMLSSFALFAFWFGSETVFGATSEFIQHGLLGVIEDPFGGFLGLVLFAMIFVRPLYRKNMFTLGDLFRKAFGARVEYTSSFFMSISFLGYVAAQIIALSILFDSVFGFDAITGKLISAGIVTLYTAAGGMWAISITDFIQSVVIVVGLTLICIDLTGLVDFAKVFDKPQVHFFDFVPTKSNGVPVINYVAAWLTLGLGSLASQDVFQRANAARSEIIAVNSTYFGAFLYLIVAMLPLYMGLLIFQLEPDLALGDSQYALVGLVSGHAPFWLQVLFYGALISAIFSTCSGALLAPSSILAENLLKPLLFPKATDRAFLVISRISVVIVGILSTILALTATSIYHLVAESSVLGAVSILVPMSIALFTKNKSSLGAFLAMFLGLAFYFLAQYIYSPWNIPSLFIGIAFSFIGMVSGTIIDRARRAQRFGATL